MRLRNSWMIILFIIGYGQSDIYTQSYIIQGEIHDAHTQGPLQGVSVISPDSSVYDVSDPSGRFILKASKLQGKVSFSLLGYKPLSVIMDTAYLYVEMEPMAINLKEVILIGVHKFNHQKQKKPLSSLDEYLDKSKNINMIRRGGYAWEPSINNMSSERLSVTIDGMHIFEACTDKMDPVTSYIDVSNLKEVDISSGQHGSVYGHSIGGALDLQLNHGHFQETGFSGSLLSGFETNNTQRVLGGKINYNRKRFYVNLDATYRKAENYHSGKGKTIDFSQYSKANAKFNAGLQLHKGKSIRASLIYDRAWDIGYPALTMDVSLARAIITSVSYKQDTLFNQFKDWESRVYFNKIYHQMDDSKRPNVPIHMDMPGWSDTYGFYSQARVQYAVHYFFFKIDGYYHNTIAEMTMYPQNSEQPLMFMLTWPDVHTTVAGIYGEDRMFLGNEKSLRISTRLSVHSSDVKSESGLKSLKIFNPDMQKVTTHFLKSLGVEYNTPIREIELKVGLSYGDRALSVSEGYGFYLFNTFDRYDYIGNPDLKLEQSLDGNISLSYSLPKLRVTGSARYFRISNYILGRIIPETSPMNPFADGVKEYINLDYAQIFNTSLSGHYDVSQHFKVSAGMTYHRGIDQDAHNLPLISPISFDGNLDFSKNSYTAGFSFNSAMKQKHYSPAYGETGVSGYAIFSVNAGKHFRMKTDDLYMKVGIDNLLDKLYSSYNDWNHIPRMGRNFYFNLTYNFN